MPKTDKPITWLQFNNIFPIITSAVLITISFLTLQTKVELLNQKMDMVLSRQEEILTKYADVETRYGQLALKVQALETKHSMDPK